MPQTTAAPTPKRQLRANLTAAALVLLILAIFAFYWFAPERLTRTYTTIATAIVLVAVVSRSRRTPSR